MRGLANQLAYINRMVACAWGWMALVVALWLMGIPLRAVAEELAPGPSTPALLDQSARTYTTPKAIAAFLDHGFTFQRDEELFGEADRWQAPEEFVARTAGDCEDYALLARALLRRNGIEAYVFSVFGKEGYAHTVCVFKDDRGRYNLIDGGKLRHLGATSLDAVASWLYPAWTVSGIAEQAGAHGQMVNRLTNSHLASFSAFTDPIASVSF